MEHIQSFNEQMEDALWIHRAETEGQEVENIKAALKKSHGGVCDGYIGPGSKKANELRVCLQIHRCAFKAALEHRNPTESELRRTVKKLNLEK